MTSAKSFAVLQTESSWGTVGSDVDRYVPLTSFGLKADTETREAKPACGVLQNKQVGKVRRTIRGPISCPLIGYFAPSASESFAQYLMEWAFGSPESVNRPSKSLNWFDDVTGSRWSGLRVDEATLAGDANGISLTLNLIGKTEQEASLTPTLPADRGAMLEFLFSDLSLTFDGSPLLIDSFNWTVRHGLSLKYNSGYTPSSLRSTTGQQSLTIKPLKTGNAFAVAQRLTTTSIKTASLTLKGLHGGTASNDYTQCVVAFNRLALMDANDAIAPDSYNWQPLTFSCLKPNSSTVAVQQTWSTV